MIKDLRSRIDNICKKGLLIACLFFGGFCFQVQAQQFHCERDTAEAMNIVRELFNPGGKPGEVSGEIARRMVGRAYEPITKTDERGEAEIRLDGFDDMSLVNMIASMSKLAVNPGFPRVADLGYQLNSYTFRRGEPDGFPTRMIYGGDWILDNRSRQNLKDLTEDYSDKYKTKSLEGVSRNREEYAALKDSAVYDRQKMVEMGYRTFKIPHLPRESAGWKEVVADMRDGDIVMLLSPNPQMDIFEIGIVTKRDDGFHFIHASERDGKVVEESDNLARYIKRHAKETYGWRWLRLQ